jgi:hypothetical protein
MYQNIKTKFTVVTGDEIDTLMLLTKNIALAKFSALVQSDLLERYIAENYTEKTLITEVNSMSNQWLVVYADGQPAGYARITSKGRSPELPASQTRICIADFGLLEDCHTPEVRASLMDKCLAVCRSYGVIWINEYENNPLLSFFEESGFIRLEQDAQLEGLPLDSVYLIRER